MIYSFDDCEINTRLFTLRRLGETKRLRPKVFEVLIYLLEHRDGIVSKQELAENVWPHQFIADSSLESTVRAMRQALGDSGREQRIIQTLPGRGYRFIGRITGHVDEPTSDEGQAKTDEPSVDPAQDVVETAPAAITSMEAESWRCPACQHVNAGNPTEGDQRCAACGRHFQRQCPRCGAANTPQANFCSSCGMALTESLSTSPPFPMVSASDPTLAPPMAPQALQGDLILEAERRQLTVISCDLVDAATLLGRLELEELRDVTHAYHRVCAAVVQRFGGYMAERLGTRLLLYFGYPVAHEDDAQRAVRAGLDLLKALEALNSQLAQGHSLRLAVRLGIHTGLVVVEDQDGGRQAIAVFGTPLTIAEQIRELAPPNAVVISATTAHLVQGYFACQDIGLHELQGVPEPVRLSRVVEASGAQSRLDIVETAGLTPFVGRETEMSLLLDRWEQVQDGSGHVVLLSGEAGIGKSRLVQVMQERFTEDTYIPLDLRCSPSSQNSALYPVIDFFHRRVLQWRQDDTPREKLKKLETALAQYEVPLSETVPLLAALFSLPHPGKRYPPLQLTPQQQREQTLSAIVTVVLALASRRPVFLMVEDLHWIDPSTLELLTLLVEQTPAAAIFAVFTFRPTFEVPWGNRSYLTQITLSRLPHRQVEQMVMQVIRGKALPEALRQRVVEQTDGVPLFIEEYLKSILETGLLQETGDRYELTAPLPALTVPVTLHDSLMARLDRLATAKSVAQLGAVIGRQFPYALLRAVWQQDETILQRELDRLVEAELVYPRGVPPQITYLFKHALIQETAYQSLLRRTRQHYHRQIAQVLDEQFPETAALQPELLAHHYTEAGLHEQAVPYWQQAGELAVERSANAEAVSHFTKGLEVLKSLSLTPERLKQELALQLALGPPLRMIKGHTAPEVERVYNRAYELCQLMGDNPQQFSTMVSLWRFYLNRGNLQKVHELANQCFTLAQGTQDQVLIQESYRMLGSTLFFLGEPASAHVHLQQGIRLYDVRQGRSRAFSGGMDTGVVCLSMNAWSLWILGYPDRALTNICQALTLAAETSHAFSLGFALNYASVLYGWRRDLALAQKQAEAMISISKDHGFLQLLNVGMIRRGWALTQQGAVQEGMQQLHQGLAAWREMGTELGLSHHLAMLADAYRAVGQAEAGLSIMAEALYEKHQNTGRYYEAELYRLKGELFLQKAIGENKACATDCLASVATVENPHMFRLLLEVETCFHQAINIARHQSAKSLELRAVISLCRLWQYRGKRSEARQMLEDIYTWFTEGFDTPDLQEAKALIETLS